MALALEGSNGFLHCSLHRWSRVYEAIVKIVANTQFCCPLERLRNEVTHWNYASRTIHTQRPDDPIDLAHNIAILDKL